MFKAGAILKFKIVQTDLNFSRVIGLNATTVWTDNIFARVITTYLEKQSGGSGI